MCFVLGENFNNMNSHWTKIARILLGAIISFSGANGLAFTLGFEPIGPLPQKGDFAIGMGTNWVFSYIGNLFRTDGGNSLAFNLINGNQFYGKYFLNAQQAVRSRLNISYNNYQYNYPPDLDGGQVILNHTNYTCLGADLTMGFERRRGSGRLQFSYGPEASIGTSMEKSTYNHPYPLSNNIKEEKTNGGLILGERAFAGIEYFFMPKVSIGGELGFGIRSSFFAKKTYTFYGGQEATIDNPNLSIGSNNLGGQLFLLFHL